MTNKYDKNVFIFNHDDENITKIEKINYITLLEQHAEECCSPRGIEKKYFVEEHLDPEFKKYSVIEKNQSEVTDFSKVQSFDTKEEAEEFLTDCDFFESHKIVTNDENNFNLFAVKKWNNSKISNKEIIDFYETEAEALNKLYSIFEHDLDEACILRTDNFNKTGNELGIVDHYKDIIDNFDEDDESDLKIINKMTNYINNLKESDL